MFQKDFLKLLQHFYCRSFKTFSKKKSSKTFLWIPTRISWGVFPGIFREVLLLEFLFKFSWNFFRCKSISCDLHRDSTEDYFLFLKIPSELPSKISPRTSPEFRGFLRKFQQEICSWVFPHSFSEIPLKNSLKINQISFLKLLGFPSEITTGFLLHFSCGCQIISRNYSRDSCENCFSYLSKFFQKVHLKLLEEF